MKWLEEEITLAVKLLGEGKNFLEIASIIGKTQNSVTKKLNRMGYKSSLNLFVYNKLDWSSIQESHNNGKTYRDLINEYKLTPQAIAWAKENGYLNFRNFKDGIKLARDKGNRNVSKQEGLNRYRQLCAFRFNVYHFPHKFDLELINEWGWYKARNRGDNFNGVSRDHMYSIKEGFLNNVDPYLISHPANCELMQHSVNNKKKTKCSITLDELYKRVKEW